MGDYYHMNSITPELINIVNTILIKYGITFDIKMHYDSFRGDYDSELNMDYDLFYSSLTKEYGKDLCEIIFTAIDCIGFEEVFSELENKRISIDEKI